MMTLADLFYKHQIGLTVYSPDCTQSRLWGNLDHFIQAKTQAQIVYRQWVYHDYNTIMAFYNTSGEGVPYRDPIEARRGYENISASDLKYGHLTARLFMSGASLLTLWQGDDMINRLLEVKGATHPAEADPDTIRGSFWCDNGVCNLIHSSDTVEEAFRELEAIQSDTVLQKETIIQQGFQPIPSSKNYIPHSAIVILCHLVNRLLIADGNDGIVIRLPQSGEAQATYQKLAYELHKLLNRATQENLINLIHAYLADDIVAISAMLPTLPLTNWEAFVFQCGVITGEKWKLEK